MQKPEENQQSLKDIIPDIFRFSLYLAGNMHDAEDITQNVCLKFLKYQHSYDPRKGSLWQYLKRLTVNETRNFYSRKKPSPMDDSPVLVPSSDPSNEQVAEKKHMADLILALLTELSSREREIFVMREIMDMEYMDISDCLGISQVTVRRFYSLARTRLKDLFLLEYPEYSNLLNS